jgi:mannosyltransferase
MRRPAVLGLLVVLLLLAAALRFYRLDAQSFWNDEGNSARLSERPVALIVEGAAADIHPPLYYLLLRAWRAPLGASEFSLRAFSAFTGVLLVAIASRLAHDLAGLRTALVGALLVTVNPALVYYSQETRMYGLLAFWAVLSLLLMVRWQRRDMRGKALAGALLLSNSAGLYTHYFYPAVLLVQGGCLLLWLWPQRRRLRANGRRLGAGVIRWAGVMLGAVALYAPWLPVMLRQVGGRQPYLQPLLDYLTDGARWLSFGRTAPAEDVLWPLVVAVTLIFIGWIPVPARRSERGAPALAQVTSLGLVVPVLLMWLLGATQEPFLKFLLVAAPFAGLALAQGIERTWHLGSALKAETVGRSAAAIALLALAPGIGHSLQNLYFDPAYARADYRGAAATVAAENHPNAGVVLNAANQWEVFTYYHTEGAPVYPLPRGQPDPVVIEAELRDITLRHERLYALFWGEAERDPERLVERWLDTHAFKANEQWLGDVRFVTYAVPGEGTGEMATRAGLKFGESITLVGYTLGTEMAGPGEIIPLALFWQTDAPLGERYKVFLHLVREGQREPLAQRDSEPGGGLKPTTIWLAGETVADNHGLPVPSTAEAGTYEIYLGLYELADPTARLPVWTAQGAVDAVRLGVIQVR